MPACHRLSTHCAQVLKIGRPPPHPPLSEFMREEQKLAGVRLDADLMARARLGHSTSISLLDYAEGVAEAKDKAPLVSQLPERPLQVCKAASTLPFALLSGITEHTFALRTVAHQAR
jgi:hypothetical protein